LGTTAHWGSVPGVFLTNVYDLRIYLTLGMAKSSEERSFSKLKMVERTKEHHYAKQAEQPDTKEYRA